MPKISIVVPAYNEEDCIESTVSDLSKEFPDAEIIVVCNGCTDSTFDVCSNINVPNLKVLEFKEAIGKGGAVIEGFRVAKGDYVGFVDSDGSFSPSSVKKVVEELDEYDSAIASKWKGMHVSDVSSGAFRKVGSRVWNFLARKLVGLDFEDTQAGLKFFRKAVVEEVLKKPFVCKGFDFDVELLYRVSKAGYRTKEVYVPVIYNRRSSFGIGDSPKMFANMLKFYFSKDR